jgi:hypothetical protein
VGFQVDIESSIYETDSIMTSKNKKEGTASAVPLVVGERVDVSHPGELTSCSTERLSQGSVTIVTKM